ncbi:MAG TPA: RbsD/FucU domain-containing protein [Acidisarcina sp.]|nr:RbsD/FucU domain-containing protein [Acidisarcina sp.]
MRTTLCSVLLTALSLGSMPAIAAAATPHTTDPNQWQARMESALPLMGHRNWILIVDSAYPLQTSPGIETIETNADQMEVIRAVMSALGKSPHVRSNIYMDAELPFVPEKSAPGVTEYRTQITQLFHGQNIQTLPHDQIIGRVAEAGKSFKILVLKSKMTIPYTSVFLQLDCKYWSAESEKELRGKMIDAGLK